MPTPDYWTKLAGLAREFISDPERWAEFVHRAAGYVGGRAFPARPTLTDKGLSYLSTGLLAQARDEEVKALHQHLHHLAADGAHEDQLSRAHLLCTQEYGRRKMRHARRDELDRWSTQDVLKGLEPEDVHVPALLAPVKPSHGEPLGGTITASEVARHVGAFKVADPFLAVVGGAATQEGGTEGDVDFWVAQPDLERIAGFRLARMLPDELESRMQLVADSELPFTDYLPLGYLAFVPYPPGGKEIVRMSELVKQELRTPALQAEAEASLKEDRLRPDRFFFPAKPQRVATGKRQTQEEFLALVEGHYPLYASKKSDGVTVFALQNKGSLRIISDDGSDMTKSLPEMVKALQSLSDADFVLAGELERWEGTQHYPREATKGLVARGQEGGLALSLFDKMYWGSEEGDLHSKPFSRRWELARRLAKARGLTITNDKPRGKVSILSQHLVKTEAELKVLLPTLLRAQGSEGVVAVAADAAYPLDGGSKLATNRRFKMHKAFTIQARVLSREETKTEGVYVYRYGLEHGGEVVPTGKTFGAAQDHPKGATIEVEGEQLNLERRADGSLRASVWVPELLGRAEGDPDSFLSAARKAREAGVLQVKVRGDGEIHYFPTNEGLEEITKLEVAKADPYLDVPSEGKAHKGMVHLHARGDSLHADIRFQVDDHLIGFTLNAQRAGTVKLPPRPSVTDVARLAEGFMKEKGNRYLKPFAAAGAGMHLVTETKAPEPLEWARFEGVVEPGSVGATKREPGTFWIMDQGRVEFGRQSADFHEYFLSGWKHLNGVFVVRRLKNVWGPERTGEAAFVWMSWWDSDPTPYVLSSRARQKGWVPPEGVSALPGAVREAVPGGLRYWEKEGEEAKAARDGLVGQLEFSFDGKGQVRAKARVEPVQKAGTFPYSLTRRWWKGQESIRFGPSREEYHLLVGDVPGGLTDITVDNDPRDTPELNALVGREDDRMWLRFEGELKPGQPGNPTKNTPAHVEILEQGMVTGLERKPDFIKFSFPKKSDMGGAWVLRREGGEEMWRMTRAGRVGEPLERYSFERRVPIAKVDAEKHLVYGIVAEPDVPDAHGDWMSADEIEQACHKFLVDSRKMYLEHREPLSGVQVVENYIAPSDLSWDSQKVRKGSWLLVSHVDPQVAAPVWEAVKSGELTGYSYRGWAYRKPAKAP